MLYVLLIELGRDVDLLSSLVCDKKAPPPAAKENQIGGIKNTGCMMQCKGNQSESKCAYKEERLVTA